jgi:NagD protein
MTTLGSNSLVLFGWDGTLHLGHQPLRGAAELLQEFRSLGAHILVISNDSTCGPAGHATQAAEMGLPLNEGDFLTASMIAISRLRIRFPGREVYVVGSRALREELAGAAIPLADEEPSSGDTVVLVGRTPQPDFDQVAVAMALLKLGAPFLGANSNLTWPTAHGERADCGALCALLSAVTGREPVLLGKPDAALVDQALGLRLGARREETILVGADPLVDGRLAAEARVPFLRIGVGDPSGPSGATFATPEDLRDHLRETRITDPVLAAWHRAGGDLEHYF